MDEGRGQCCRELGKEYGCLGAWEESFAGYEAEIESVVIALN